MSEPMPTTSSQPISIPKDPFGGQGPYSRRRQMILYHDSNHPYLVSESLPSHLDIPNILPDGFDRSTPVPSVPLDRYKTITLDTVATNDVIKTSQPQTITSKKEKKINTTNDNYISMEPVWLQTASNGMVILPEHLKPLPPLYIPREFLFPGAGIITPRSYSSAVKNSLIQSPHECEQPKALKQQDTQSNIQFNLDGDYSILSVITDTNGTSQQADNIKTESRQNKVASLFTDNVNVTFPNVSRIDWSKNIIIVDLSYMTYKRFFATRTWYNNAFPERNVPKDHDWCKDTDFMEKFRKLFLKHLIAQGKTRNVPETNIIFAIDCRHVDNWRVMGCKNYKSTRKESHVKNNFHNFDVFPIVRNEIIADMQSQYGNLMLVHKHLEADDVVALLVKYIRRRYRPAYENSIYIVANDRDYIQICDDNTFLIDLDGKAISSLVLSETCNKTDYLLAKILQGDTSDNIPACYFSKEFLALAGIKTSRKHLKATPSAVKNVMDNPETKQHLMALLDKCRLRIDDPYISYTETELAITKDNQFDYNARHMDFQHIPSKYATEINVVFSRCLGF